MMSLLALLVLLWGSPAGAADQEPIGPIADPPKASALAELGKWFTQFKKALADSSVRQQQRRMRGAVAVAAVRGSGQGLEDPGKPYWKGTAESTQERESRRERAELAKAADLALGGHAGEALKALDAFEAKHPNSALLEDCRQAREKLKVLPPEPAVAKQEEVPAAPAPSAEPAQAAAPAPEAAPAATAGPETKPAAEASQAPLADEVPEKGGDR